MNQKILFVIVFAIFSLAFCIGCYIALETMRLRGL